MQFRRVFLWRQARDLYARADVLLSEPSLIHFERITRRFFCAVRIERLGLHIFDVDDAPFFIDESDRQRKQCVLHSHADMSCFRKAEHHAFAGGHFFAEHQALRTLYIADSDFCLDKVNANAECRHRKCLLRMAQRGKGSSGPDGNTEKKAFHGELQIAMAARL